MARLVIHIGTHKTGTTFLQHKLALARPWLEERGFVYPDLGRPAHHPLIAHWVGLKRELEFCPDPVPVWQAIAAAQRTQHTLTDAANPKATTPRR